MDVAPETIMDVAPETIMDVAPETIMDVAHDDVHCKRLTEDIPGPNRSMSDQIIDDAEAALAHTTDLEDDVAISVLRRIRRALRASAPEQRRQTSPEDDRRDETRVSRASREHASNQRAMNDRTDPEDRTSEARTSDDRTVTPTVGPAHGSDDTSDRRSLEATITQRIRAIERRSEYGEKQGRKSTSARDAGAADQAAGEVDAFAPSIDSDADNGRTEDDAESLGSAMNPDEENAP